MGVGLFMEYFRIACNRQFLYDTTMHQAVLLCTRTGSRVLVLHDDPGAVQGKDIGHVILLDDIMQFLFGSES